MGEGRDLGRWELKQQHLRKNGALSNKGVQRGRGSTDSSVQHLQALEYERWDGN